MKYLLVISTFPDPEKARQIGTALVEKQLAACVNLLPAVESIYRWKNAVETDTETLALIKTTETAFPALESTLRDLHPYEVPEIIALDITAGSQPYLDWLTASVQ